MDYKDEFDKGYVAYKHKEFDKAREIFESLKKQDKNYFNALRLLVNIDIKQHQFREARERIENDMYYDNVNTLRLLSIIEHLEYNYDAAISCIKEVIDRFGFNVTNFYNLTLFYILEGRFMEAREVLRNIPEKYRNTLSDFYYILIDIVYCNYERALDRLLKIYRTNMAKSFYILYDKAISLLYYYLGKNKDEIQVLSFKGKKFRDILYSDKSDNVDILLEKLMWYKNERENSSNLKYRSDIDFRELIEEIQYKITKMNPQYYNFMSNYSIILDDVVGYNGEVPIYGVSVSTPLGVNKISSINLTDFSSEYDREHLSTDKNLRKRLLVK